MTEVAESAIAAIETTEQQEQEDRPVLSKLSSCRPGFLEDYEISWKSILGSIAQRAQLERWASIAADDDDDADVPPIIRQSSKRQEAVQKLLDAGAEWQPTHVIHDVSVYKLANVPYGTESPKQRLNIYFPGETNREAENEEGEEHTSSQSTDKNTNDHDKKPVHIHIHGGGWSRGNKDSPFYGGPAMCQNSAADAGCISIAIGYRLGHYPEFIHDAALAIRWAYDNIESLGGDLSNVFLSGHSAGAHIASLLVIRHYSFLEEPFGIPNNFFRGLILVSGVYDLFSPMRRNALDFKNKWLFLYYVTPAFGTDQKLKREASPLLLLDPNKDISIWGTAMATITKQISQRILPVVPQVLSDRLNRSSLSGMMSGNSEVCSELLEWEWTRSTRSCPSTKEEQKDSEQQGYRYLPPSTLILNATYDMGLQENGQLMAEALGEYTNVTYQIIEGSDHASICWNDNTARVVADFVHSKLTTTTTTTSKPDGAAGKTAAEGGEKGTATTTFTSTNPVPRRPRRGKRDKIPRKEDPEEN